MHRGVLANVLERLHLGLKLVLVALACGLRPGEKEEPLRPIGDHIVISGRKLLFYGVTDVYRYDLIVSGQGVQLLLPNVQRPGEVADDHDAKISLSHSASLQERLS